VLRARVSSIVYILTLNLYPETVRNVCLALFCIVFSVSCSLIPAAHTVAHAQAPERVGYDMTDGHGHVLAAQGHDHHDEDSGDDQSPEDRTGNHASGLHFAALGALAVVTVVPPLVVELNEFYADRERPAPLLPPDPDPDRA
jgi:hypothetical protein